MSPSPRIVVLPAGGSRLARAATEAVEAGGGTVVEAPEDADALIWTSTQRSPDAILDFDTTAAALRAVVQRSPRLHWVQLPSAGVEEYSQAGVLDHSRVWTSGKGLYSRPVAEHALALTLACVRHLKEYSRADRWTGGNAQTLYERRVTIFGGGGIAQELIRLFTPFHCQLTVVRKRPGAIEGADASADVRVLGWDERDAALRDADAVVLALALTQETAGLFDKRRFDAMQAHACLVNVARGKHVVSDDLAAALGAGQIAAAGLDVTEPEPLPDGHPLWSLDNCLVTPHTASTPDMAFPRLLGRITSNVRRFAAGQSLAGRVDPDLGY